ncbi:endonuclease III [Anoxynatronum buryatiense]|uniref:endonuclease III n=1 Tax=Anoxynatronum buryatiense TaxID=489973 RepID=UPI003211D470
MKKKAVLEVLEILEATYPSAESELDFTNPFECLVATMLSAQCTDQRVNLITATLFKEIKGPEDVVQLSEEELQQKIRSCNYYKTKSKHLLAACQQLLAQHNGCIPNNREALMALPGVGRKTANVVLSNAFGVPALAVDTHVFRVSNRLGLVRAGDPLETEQQLMKTVPSDKWSAAHHWLILHGRRVCHARKPNCISCSLNHLCPTFRASKQ